MFKAFANFFSGGPGDAQGSVVAAPPVSALSRREALEATLSQAVDDHNAIIERLVDQHARALRKNIRRHQRFDDYGKEVGFNEIGEAVAHFVSHVIRTDPAYPKARQSVLGAQMEMILFGKNPNDYELEAFSSDLAEKFDNNQVPYVYVLALSDKYSDKTEGVPDVSRMSGDEFEIYCEDRLTAVGWSVCRKGGTGDQGVDLIATRAGVAVAVQCKRHAGAIGNQAIQQVEAGRQFEEADYAAVVANSNYTTSAEQLAAKLGVVLLHHSELDLLIQRIGVR